MLTLKTESGHECLATCEGKFDPDIVGPTTINYTDEDGEPQEIELYGSIMTEESNQQDIQAKFKINQDERLTIANIPADSTYSITETQTTGYGLVSIETDNQGTQNGYTVTGTIVKNSDNNVTYKNRRDEADLEIYKVTKDSLDKETKVFLKDAEFTVTQLDENGTGGYKLDDSSEESPKPLYYQEIFTTDDNGKAHLESLQPGYYEIKMRSRFS